MNHLVIYSAKARSDLKKISIPIARRIIKKIKFFSEADDPLSFAKPLTNRSFGEYRFRVGDYRVLFDCDKKGSIRILKILKIGHRKDIYL